MKWLGFERKSVKNLSLLVLSFVISGNLIAQTDVETKSNDVDSDYIEQTRYDKRVARYKSRWDKLIPSHVKLQYAGSMGIFSLGTGWDYGKNNQWETDVILGYVPRYSSDDAHITLTLKQNFIPWRIACKNKKFEFEPLATGLYLNTIFGSNFWMNEPDKYPNNYYQFSSKMRVNIYIGQRFSILTDTQKFSLAKKFTFFYEISTNELYVISAVQNSYLKPKDYLHLSFGVKMQIF